MSIKHIQLSIFLIEFKRFLWLQNGTVHWWQVEEILMVAQNGIPKQTSFDLFKLDHLWNLTDFQNAELKA